MSQLNLLSAIPLSLYGPLTDRGSPQLYGNHEVCATHVCFAKILFESHTVTAVSPLYIYRPTRGACRPPTRRPLLDAPWVDQFQNAAIRKIANIPCR